MDKEIKVVIGANYGDEGKGLVSYCLSRKARSEGRKVLNVFYNGGAQRAHTSNGVVRHCTGAGTSVGADTYYNKWFVVDPIAVWLEQAEVYVHPDCRIVLPCDVVNNRQKELARGANKHGSCGMGIFECVSRSRGEEFSMNYHHIVFCNDLYNELIRIEKKYGYPRDLVYNNDNFIRGCEWMKEHCEIINDERAFFRDYDTIIFEGGQGLLLDQIRYGDGKNVHLTPSSPGIRNCAKNIAFDINVIPDLYYVSRGYLTRHGAGMLSNECKREDISKEIIDKTNQPNPWQDSLRFGYLDQVELHNRVYNDALDLYKAAPISSGSINLVYTQLNYTEGKIAVPNGKEDILNPAFIDNIYVSDQKDEMELLR